ncbi:hypothetical protein L618_004000000220 [Rhodococcus rhodochrous J45]|uniref:Transposase n=1 Tax=Rhodococcus rhodochrous J45 TaxID=935266 RepID=A0A562DLE1_RHORH|nr:hypothetical protein L618_004000000220 [Rhodococcus rhodochrous J45]
MGRQSLYTEEFRKDAIVLYRAADGQRTYAAVAADEGLHDAIRDADGQPGAGGERADGPVGRPLEAGEYRDRPFHRLRARPR